MDQLAAELQNLNLGADISAVITSAFNNALAAQQTTSAQDHAQARASANDEARTLATVLKPTKPKPYHGAIDAAACLNFIENQVEYFEIVELNQNKWVKYTVVALEDEAKSWWRHSDLTINTSWDVFHDAFIAHHTPPDAVAAARTELDKLKQKQLSVSDYTHKFRQLLRLIPNMDTDTALFTYMKGLEAETSKEVRLRQPTTMAQAVHQASIVHSILHPLGPMTTAHPVSTASAGASMDVDAISVLLANLNNRSNPPYRNQRGSTPHAHHQLRKLTDAERNKLRREGACFRCRRKGHMANNCHATQALNNLEDDQGQDEDSDHAGKE